MNPRVRDFLAIAVMAAAYYVAGRLGLLLAVPPGYATAVWPPSGIALAGVLVYGVRLLPGVWLGSFLLNLPTALDRSGLGAMLQSLALPALIAAGAAAQASLGAWLIRRFVGYRNILAQESDVLRMLLLGGPAACLLNASLGVGSLWLVGSVQTEMVPFNWWTWWVGDSIGVLVFTPLLLIWSVRPLDRWWRQQLQVSLPLLAMFGLVVAVFVIISTREQARTRAEFEAAAQQIGERLQAQLDRTSIALSAAAALFGSQPEIAQDQFDNSARLLLAQTPGVLAVAVQTVVGDSEREAFEARMRARGLGDFRITEFARDGSLVPAARRPEYVVIDLVHYPTGDASKALGVDIASDPVRLAALRRAAASRGIAASARVQLLDDRHSPGVLLFAPLYQGGSAQPTAYATFVLRIADLMSEVLKARTLDGAELSLSDDSAPSAPQALFGAPAAGAARGDLTYAVSLHVGGRDWQLAARLPATYLLAHRSWQVWLVLAAGLLLTALLGVVLLLIVGRGAKVEQLVAERTEALHQSEARLRSLYESAAQAMVWHRPEAPPPADAPSVPAATPRGGWLRNRSIGFKLATVVCVYVAIIGVLLAAVAGALGISNGVRAYVQGEGLWSKGQKDAVYYLLRYAESHDPAHYAQYRAAIAVPLGDHAARVELQKPRFDYAAAARGFRQGGNDDADIPYLIAVFRWLHGVAYMAQAIDIWTRADEDIVRLEQHAADLDARVRAGSLSPADEHRLMREVEAINAHVTPLEQQFSATLGAAARWVRTLLLQAIFLAAAALLGGGLLISSAISGELRQRIQAIREGALRVARGDLSELIAVGGRDEVGSLATAFNDMIQTRRQAEDSLNRVLSLLAATLESTDDGILVVNRAHRIVRFNRRFVELWKLPEDVVASGDDERALAAVLPQLEDPEGFLAKVRELYAAPAAESFDVLKLVDGRRFERYSRPQRVGGAIAGRVWSFRDVTAREQARQALERARDEALKASGAKSSFLANMSHEIRTPMNGVLGMTAALLDMQLPPAQREIAETIRISAESLLTIINDILDLSKIEAGAMRIEIVDLSVQQAVEQAVGSLAERAQAKGLELVMTVDPAMPAALRGDPGRIQQVLVNLISNAVKFTDHGEIVVRAELLDKDAQRGRVRFSVRDTGVGISAEAQARLFQPFSQADSSTTRRFGGTGLGLAISKQLVELMGGEIGVESRPGDGAQFWFTLPLGLAETEAAPAVGAGLPHVEGLRALVVDDSAVSRSALAEQMRTWGLLVDEAANATEALRRMEGAASAGRPYSLALIDQSMPEMDGLALAREVRARPKLAGARLVLLRSLAQHEEPGALRAHGLDSVLSKPVRISALHNVLLAAGGERPARKKPAAQPVAPLARKWRILVAEDSPINQKVARHHLQRLGQEADFVENGREALHAVRRAHYDLILMDCQMPELDGYDATAEIRKAEGLKRHTWIIAMTAHAMAGDREKCLAAGMDDYVAKPVTATVLRDALERFERREAAKAGSGLLQALNEVDAVSTSPEPAPPIDVQRLTEWANNDAQFVRELSDLFVEQTSEQMGLLKQAVAARSAPEVQQIAHRCKGSAATCGADALSVLFRDLEFAGRENKLDQAEQQFAAAAAEFARAAEFLKNLKLPPAAGAAA